MSKKTFMCSDIFNSSFDNNTSKNLSKPKINTYTEYKPIIGIELLTSLIKSQNIKLIKKIADNENLNFDELKKYFLKVSYFTPDVVCKLSDEINEKKRVLKRIKNMYYNI